MDLSLVHPCGHCIYKVYVRFVYCVFGLMLYRDRQKFAQRWAHKMGLASFVDEHFTVIWKVCSGDTSGLQNVSRTNFICLETEKAVECWGGPSSSSSQVQPWWQALRSKSNLWCWQHCQPCTCPTPGPHVL